MDWLEPFLYVFGVPLFAYTIRLLIVRRVIARYFKALNRHDLTKLMSAWQDDGVFIYPGEIPASGTFTGKGAVESWFRNFFEQFPSIKIDVQDVCFRHSFFPRKDNGQIFGIKGNNVVVVHWSIQLTNRSGRAGQNSGVTVFGITGFFNVVMAKDFIFDLGKDFKHDWGSA